MPAGAEKPVGGIQFPTDEKGGRSTTAAAKQIWVAAVGGAAEGNGDETPETVAEGIKKEEDWRFQYPKHLSALGRVSVKSKANALAIAQKGLDAIYDSFEFEREGETMKLTEAMSKYTTGTFGIGMVKGKLPSCEGKASLPYKGASLEGDELKAQMNKWAEYGTLEPSAANAIIRTVDEQGKWLDLTGQYFVLLGAGSELGPIQTLLRCGATVIAIRTRKPKAWQESFEFAANSPGILIYPKGRQEMSETATSNIAEGPPGAAQDEGPPEELAGCDLMLETPEIRNWLLAVVPPGVPVTVGCYTYLDSDAHVRVSIACDVIMAELAEKRNAALAYIASPCIDCLLPDGCTEAMESNRANAPSWQTDSGCPMPKVSVVEGSTIIHGFMELQGPNYALAKTLQNWRCFLAREAGNVVSANIGPACRTQSVVHNPMLAVLLDSAAYIAPKEAFYPDTGSVLMALLLIHDLRNPTCVAQPSTDLKHPWALISDGAVHSGEWRCGFDVAASKELGATLYGLGKTNPIK